MERFGFADAMRVNIIGDKATVKIEEDGRTLEFDVPAWEIEE